MLQKISESSDQMTLSRMGTRYPSRFSFSRSMLRKLFHENNKNTKGYGGFTIDRKINLCHELRNIDHDIIKQLKKTNV